jgi:uncharacterized protein YbaA (DUF1428 family)
MSNYVDVYVLPVPKNKLDAYRRLAAEAGKIWRENGAVAYIEVIADDVKAGVHTSFPQAVKLEADETVVVGWVVFNSREDRDRINAAVMKDPRLSGMNAQKMPFDAKRMFWGGFTSLVEV